MNKDEEIKKQMKKLNKILKFVDDNKKDMVKNLIEEACFMKVTLISLKETINEKGEIDEMSQGSYSILREHPALKSYNATIQRFTSLMKQLSDFIPKEDKLNIDDGFDEFVKIK